MDFGTGLFLNKTPSEESGGSGGPHSGGSGGPPLTPATGATDSPLTDTSSFFPTNIISSVGASVGAMGASVGASVGAMGASVGASVGATVEAVGASVNAMGATVGAVGYVGVCCLSLFAHDFSSPKSTVCVSCYLLIRYWFLFLNSCTKSNNLAFPTFLL